MVALESSLSFDQPRTILFAFDRNTDNASLFLFTLSLRVLFVDSRALFVLGTYRATPSNQPGCFSSHSDLKYEMNGPTDGVFDHFFRNNLAE